MESFLIALGLAGLAAVGLVVWRWSRAFREVLRRSSRWARDDEPGRSSARSGDRWAG